MDKQISQQELDRKLIDELLLLSVEAADLRQKADISLEEKGHLEDDLREEIQWLLAGKK